MNYVFDTNIISAIIRSDSKVIARMSSVIAPSDTILGCPMVWYEARRGLLAKDARSQIRRFEGFFARFQWDNFTPEDWALAADLWTIRRKMGAPIEDADLLIGVFARNRNAILITNNEKDFVALGITIENWTK